VHDENVQEIMNKLKSGDPLPPILLDYDYGILDGHHRWEAAKRLRIKKIPVVVYENPGYVGTS
jgi:ParB-like chromosome segregation protein Spo0J